MPKIVTLFKASKHKMCQSERNLSEVSTTPTVYKRTANHFCDILGARKFLWPIFDTLISLASTIQGLQGPESWLFILVFAQKSMDYWVWESYGLWYQDPCLPTLFHQKGMGYMGVWLLPGMAFEGVYCTPRLDKWIMYNLLDILW